ncbi:MAG: hypothetical protein ACLSXF_05825 [Clostridium sp.]
MKKQYEKPMIYVEDFTMCQNVAAGCSQTEGAQHFGGECPFADPNMGGVTIFNSDLGCTIPMDKVNCQDGTNEYGGYFFS